jgi:hypothetical protein
MKYKVGETVRIRKGLEGGKDYSGVRFAATTMSKYLGKQAKITMMSETFYNLDIDDGHWNWSDEMLEPLKKTLTTLEVGDKVKGEYENYKEVLAVLNRNGWKTVYGLSGNWTVGESKDLIESAQHDLYFYTAHQLKKYSFKPVTYRPKSSKIVKTMSEIAEKFGIDPKNLRIKK